MRLIDADALCLGKFQSCGMSYQEGWNDALDAATTQAPTIDAVEVVHGYWKERLIDDFRMVEVKCSECGWAGIENYDAYIDPSDFNYCPNCGAKMDGEDNGRI